MSKSKKAATANESELTPQRAFRIFICFFIVFACIGYLRGNSAKRDEKSLSALTWSRLTVEKDSRGIVFSYNCPDLTIMYHIDNNKINDLSLFNKSQPNDQSTNSGISIFDDEKLITTLLGGASAWTIRDAFEYITSSGSGHESRTRITKTALAVLGAISGYNAGYYISIHDHIECSSPEMKERLKNHAVWSEWEGLEWAEKYKNARAVQGRLFACTLPDRFVVSQKDPEIIAIEAIQSRLKHMEDRVSEENYDFKTQDFDDLDTLIADTESLTRTYALNALCL